MNAYAAGMTPDVFWASTPKDISLACQGVGIMLERYQRLAAWHLAPILNMASKERITPSMLMGEEDALTRQVHGRLQHPDPRGAMAALTRAYLESEGD
jgi:hypothetical protein